MINKKLILACLISCLWATGLSCSSSSATTNNSQRIESSKDNVNALQINKNDVSNLNQTAKPKPLFVILGRIYAENNKIEFNGEFWGYDEENEEEAKLYPENKVELDIMNCAGYLASATTTYTTSGGGSRKVKLIPESIAPDAVRKIKQCTLKPNHKILGCDVFGIAPKSSARKNIKIAKVDAKKLYNSLLKDIDKTVAEEKRTGKSAKVNDKAEEVEIPEEDKEPLIGEPKDKLLLEDDNWTDMDGDGQIDLIKFHDTPCYENDTCTSIYQLIGGRWKEIQYIFPL